MARKVQISKEVILHGALELLIDKGFSYININTLSEKIGCSTQPIVWHFGNMVGLRDALAEYAKEYAARKIVPHRSIVMDGFEDIGRGFATMAVEEPHLFRFLYIEGYNGQTAETPDAILKDGGNAEIIEGISSYFHISKEGAGRYLKGTIIFNHGICSLVATGKIKATVDEIMVLTHRAASAFLIQEGVPKEMITAVERIKEE